MTARYRVIMYERTTDQVGGIIDVPAALAVQALAIAGIADADEPGELNSTISRLYRWLDCSGFERTWPDTSTM